MAADTRNKHIRVHSQLLRLSGDAVLEAAVGHVMGAEGYKVDPEEPSVRAAHAFLAFVFDNYTPRTQLPQPKFHAVRERLRKTQNASAKKTSPNRV